jgi:hypothetical protein
LCGTPKPFPELRPDIGEVWHLLDGELIDQPAIDGIPGVFAGIVEHVERRLVRAGGNLVEPLHRGAEHDIDGLAGALLKRLDDAFAQALLPDAAEGTDRQVRCRCAGDAGQCHHTCQQSASASSDLISHHNPFASTTDRQAFTIVKAGATRFQLNVRPKPRKAAIACGLAAKDD